MADSIPESEARLFVGASILQASLEIALRRLTVTDRHRVVREVRTSIFPDFLTAVDDPVQQDELDIATAAVALWVSHLNAGDLDDRDIYLSDWMGRTGHAGR